MAAFDETLDLLIELAQSKEKEQFQNLLRIYQDALKENGLEQIQDDQDEQHYRPKIKILVSHIDTLMQASLLLYCSHILKINKQNGFAKAIINTIVSKSRIYSDKNKRQSLAQIAHDLLDSNLAVTAEQLIALFRFALTPNNFSEATHLLCQFYKASLIDDEDSHSDVIKFKNLFVPERNEDTPENEERIPSAQINFLTFLLLGQKVERNFDLAILILEYIFPTHIENVDMYLLKLMKKTVDEENCSLDMRLKIIEILKFALAHASFIPNSPALNAILSLEQYIVNLMYIMKNSKPKNPAWELFNKNNSHVYTATIDNKTKYEFKKQVTSISIYEVLKTSKEELIGVIMSLADPKTIQIFAPEMADFFVAYYQSPVENDDLDFQLRREIMKYLKAKSAVTTMYSQENRKYKTVDFNETNNIDINITDSFHQYLQKPELYSLYLSKALDDPRWFSIAAFTLFANQNDIALCFWKKESNDTLTKMSESNNASTSMTTHILVTPNCGCYQLTRHSKADNLPHMPKLTLNMDFML